MSDSSKTRRLQDLIEAERNALLAGDFDRISDIMEEKQALVDDLDEGSVDSDALDTVRDGLRRNHELFDEALSGLRNVAARLGDLNRVRKSINTYDSEGRKRQIDAPAVKRLERRA
jgi:flagellar biosynthesis/type III secretory pathway chaperone